MKETAVQLFEIPDQGSCQIILNQLSQKYNFKEDSATTLRFTIQDTFEQKLFNKNYLFLRSPDQSKLIRVFDFKTVAKTRQKQKAAFYYQYHDSAFSDFLKRLIGQRALIPKIELTIMRKNIAILNKDHKTVMRISRYKLVGENQQSEIWRLAEIRGYGKAFTKIQQLVNGSSFILDNKEIKKRIAPIAGLAKTPYSSKVNISIQKKDPARFVLQQILQKLTLIIEENLDGICRDIDIEFLHDHRVAIRRIRTLLSLSKTLWQLPELIMQKKLLDDLQKRSNRLRDLDVFLMKFRMESFGINKSESVNILKLLKKERNTLKNSYTRYLCSKSYRSLFDEWNQFLKEINAVRDERPMEEISADKFAMKLMSKRLKKSIALAEKIKPDSADERFHKMRLELKKMRYLLEFFYPIISHDSRIDIISPFKKFQDILGELNDLSNQQKILERLVLETSGLSPKTAKAIGIIDANLDQKKRELKGLFIAQLPDFQNWVKQSLNLRKQAMKA